MPVGNAGNGANTTQVDGCCIGDFALCAAFNAHAGGTIASQVQCDVARVKGRYIAARAAGDVDGGGVFARSVQG